MIESPMSSHYSVRTMSKNDIDMALNWAAEEGWNPGWHDAESYYAADSNGFFIGELDGEPVATFSAVKYDDSFGFLGCYIVKRPFRGRGFGKRLWETGLRYLKGCNIGLDGVVEEPQPDYQAAGFQLAYRNIRYQGYGLGPATTHEDIVPLAELPFAALERYDRTLFPAPRSAFLKEWIRQPGSRALGILQRGQLAGYGVVRPCRSGYRIGPLMADHPQLAETLWQALASDIAATQPVYLDIPETNQLALALAERHHMQVVFETARMYSGEPPDIPIERLFGVTTYELG